MPVNARIVIAVSSFFLLAFVPKRIRKRPMRVGYSILWLAVCFTILAASLGQGMADQSSHGIRIGHNQRIQASAMRCQDAAVTFSAAVRSVPDLSQKKPTMPVKGRLVIAILSFYLFVFVLNLIRKRRMRIEYSILWLVVSSIILAASLFQGMADRLAHAFGIDYPPAFYYLVAIFFLIMMFLHFSIELTKLKDQNKTLIQELSMLKQIHRRRPR
jgi:hypothetical protein